MNRVTTHQDFAWTGHTVAPFVWSVSFWRTQSFLRYVHPSRRLPVESQRPESHPRFFTWAWMAQPDSFQALFSNSWWTVILPCIPHSWGVGKSLIESPQECCQTLACNSSSTVAGPLSRRPKSDFNPMHSVSVVTGLQTSHCLVKHPKGTGGG